MHLRVHTFQTNLTIPIQDGTVLYTDGSCDNPCDPYTARAAWAVVACTYDTVDNAEFKYQVLANGHCPGHQTINRAELFAILIAAEQAHQATDPAVVLFGSDSQYAVSVIERTGHSTQCP